MKKIYPKDKNEFYLIDLIMLIFGKKFKLILFISISTIIGVFYNYNLSNLYQFSLNIKPINNSEFINYKLINDFIISNPLEESSDKEKFLVTKSSIFEKFIEEFLDYEELIFVLKNNKNIEKQISQFSEYNKSLQLASIAKTFTLVKAYNQVVDSKSDLYEYLQMKFVWHDKEEGIKILDEVLDIVVNNLKNSVNKDIENYLNSIYDIKIQRDLNRIEYLTEQSLIAKELGITDRNIQIYPNQPYYLHGYKAIKKEISLIKNRKYDNILYAFDQLEEIKKKDKQKLINYNLNFLEINNLKTSFLLNIIIFGVVGFIIGVIYIVISNINLVKK